ncbi:MAG: glycosyl transferase family 1 [Desulfuromonas sp.]|nr:MAG: glycosyl transferase family 1 [Desulfuromonas sp.]
MKSTWPLLMKNDNVTLNAPIFRRASVKILHILSQIPSATGSGIYLQATMQHAHQRGHSNYLLAGVPADFHYDDHCSHLPCDTPELIRFGHDVNLEIVGMSDVMPYPSTRFCDLSAEDLGCYEACFDERLQQAVKRWQPDIIHSHHLWLLTSLARQRFPDVPMVASCHGSDLRQFHSCCHLQQQVLRGCQQVDAVCALNQGQRQQITEDYQIPAEKIHVVGAGFNDSLFHPPPPVLKDGNTIHIVYVGKLSRAKGVPWLLKALQQVAGEDWHFHLVGDSSGEEKEEIVRLAQTLGGKITRHGSLRPEDLAEQLKASHLFILPSFFEGVPLVVLEALACGCRAITTNLPGIREVFDRLNCDWLQRIELPRMASIDSPHPDGEQQFIAQLAEKITLQLAAIRSDRTAQPPLTVQEVLHHYDWNSTFCRIEQVYDKVLSGKQTATAAISS